jgi:hypothetical protein
MWEISQEQHAAQARMIHHAEGWNRWLQRGLAKPNHL